MESDMSSWLVWHAHRSMVVSGELPIPNRMKKKRKKDIYYADNHYERIL